MSPKQNFCVQCGASLSEGVRFCGECGQSIPATSNSSESTSQASTESSSPPKKGKLKTTLFAVTIIISILGCIAFFTVLQQKDATHYSQRDSSGPYDIAYPDDQSNFAAVVEEISSDENLAALSFSNFLAESGNNENVRDDLNSPIPPEPSLDSSRVFFATPPSQ